MQVSVLMTAFNAERYISEAIESVLSQVYGDFEFIINNDGSTDNTLSVIEAFARKDNRIKVFSHSNMGMGASLNKAINLVRNEWIVRMDADDIMMPNRIDRQVRFVKENQDVAVASCLVYYINELSRVIGKNTNDLRTKEDFIRYLRGNELIGFHHPATIMRKSVVQEVGGYRSEYWPADDIDLWNRIAERGYVILVQQEYLLKYRIHGASVSIYDAKRSRLMVRWLKENMIHRQKEQSELSLEEFINLDKSRSLWRRLNNSRKDLAKIFYRRGVYSYSCHSIISVVINLLIALSLQPSYVFKQFTSKQTCR